MLTSAYPKSRPAPLWIGSTPYRLTLHRDGTATLAPSFGRKALRGPADAMRAALWSLAAAEAAFRDCYPTLWAVSL